MLQSIRTSAEGFVVDHEVEALRLAVGYFPKVGVEVVDGVVGEISDQRSGDDQRAEAEGKTGQECYDSEHWIINYD